MTISMERSSLAGMTDYTGAPMSVITFAPAGMANRHGRYHQNLRAFRGKVERERKKLHSPEDILSYIQYFISLFERYLGDFERLLNELPNGVSSAHVEIVQQMYSSSKYEEQVCINFKHEHIERSLKDERLRGLIDDIYGESRQMLIDCRDLSNLTPRLRTLVGTIHEEFEKEFEQKFRILYSPAQEQTDFDSWVADGSEGGVLDRGDLSRCGRLQEAEFRPYGIRCRSGNIGSAPRSCARFLYAQGRGLSPRRRRATYHAAQTATFRKHWRSQRNCADESRRKNFLVDAGKSQRLTVSSGVGRSPLHGTKLATVIEAANGAESAAKRAGKTAFISLRTWNKRSSSLSDFHYRPLRSSHHRPRRERPHGQRCAPCSTLAISTTSSFTRYTAT